MSLHRRPSPPQSASSPAAPSAAGSVAVRGVGHRTAQGIEAVTWQVPEEVPVALVYNGTSHAVMMATPTDLEDFAVGFSVAEGLIDHPSAIEEIAILPQHHGVMVALSVTPAALDHSRAPVRAMAGRSGCGVCGVESLDQAVRPPRPLHNPLHQRATGQTPSPATIAAALAALPDHQPMNQHNKSVHAAAFCTMDGTIVLAREDVGRHNALDKLIGAGLRSGISLGDGFVVMTSRCSFELVQKASMVDIPLLATLSAPTSLALELAGAAGMMLAARSRGGGVVIFDVLADGAAQAPALGVAQAPALGVAQAKNITLTPSAAADAGGAPGQGR